MRTLLFFACLTALVTPASAQRRTPSLLQRASVPAAATFRIESREPLARFLAVDCDLDRTRGREAADFTHNGTGWMAGGFVSGVLLGLMSAGSALGGLAYGSRGWHSPLARQFAAALALTAFGLAVLAVRWEPWTLAAWSVIAGIAIAPALIIQSMLVTKAARPEHSTEAFTWTTSALLAGVGIGLAAGGAMLERLPSSAALAAGAAASLAAAVGARFLLGR